MRRVREPRLLQNCEGQQTRIDVDGSRGVAWLVLATGRKTRNGAAFDFGFGQYDERMAGPEEGTSIAATGAPLRGNSQPVYCFAGYAYSDPGPGVMRI